MEAMMCSYEWAVSIGAFHRFIGIVAEIRTGKHFLRFRHSLRIKCVDDRTCLNRIFASASSMRLLGFPSYS